MPNNDNSTEQNQLTANIVAAYVGRNQLRADQLGTLISTVHQALGGLRKPTEVERTPAVSTRRSVTPNFVVCLDCAWKGKVLRRHLTTAHGLTVDEYRTRWNLPGNHPMTAPAYSERRSAMAKHVGLGRTREASVGTMAVPEAETTTQPAPKRRGRPRSEAASA
jgi:predicted transcriptional regulator